LKENFFVARFPEVFSKTKLPSWRGSFSPIPSPVPILKAPSYAATTGSPVITDMVGSDDIPQPSMSTTAPTRREYPVLQNSKGHRLDAIINPPPTLVKALGFVRLCNAFHILGECSNKNCTFEHEPRRLDEKGIEARRLLARHTPCSSGLQCKDGKCLLGHECLDKACSRIGKSCRFAREMHGVDRNQH
jgi:hypothetical protein